MAPTRAEQLAEVERQKSAVAETMATQLRGSPPEPVRPVGDLFPNGDPFGAILGVDLQALRADPRAARLTSTDPGERAKALAALQERQEAARAQAQTDARIRAKLDAQNAAEAAAEPFTLEGYEADLARLEAEAFDETLPLEDLAAPEPWET